MSIVDLLVGAAILAIASAAPAFDRTETRAPCASSNPLRNVYFGDTHVHTTFSFDAWAQGTRNDPDDAYRFARGEAVGIQPYAADGTPLRTVRLRRPLDFAIVTDHSEMLGETRICGTPSLTGYDSLMCTIARRWPALGYMIVNSQILDVADSHRYSFCGPAGEVCGAAAAEPWRVIQRAAETAYDRSPECRFTSFVGYEWSGAIEGYMIHRNVVFRNEVATERPANYIDDKSPQRLWQRLRTECLDRRNRCDVLVIPHNSNLSGGLLFRAESADGAPLSRAEAEVRGQLEVLLEVTQHKGDSECRPGGPTADELCGFEKLPFARMRESRIESMQTVPPPLSYAREILAEGLAQEKRLGVNPFKLGLIGASDTHLGTPGLVDEDSFVGHAAGRTASRIEVPPLPDDIRMNPGGLAGVWAEENSRDSLFEAMRRREVFGTSGPRLTVRFFGGWDLPASMCQSTSLATDGYRAGVPMGATLPEIPTGGISAPTFAVAALKDPGTRDAPGAALERIQIVKSWLAGSDRHERVYDLATADRSGTLDLATCSAGGGADQLCAQWTDPDFDPRQHALYYARVLEVPTCRWNVYACARAGVDCARSDVPKEFAPCCDPTVPRAIQERAWTSPIWYSPGDARPAKQ